VYYYSPINGPIPTQIFFYLLNTPLSTTSTSPDTNWEVLLDEIPQGLHSLPAYPHLPEG